MGEISFPQDFLWGTATASYQVEGNNQNSDWWQWEQGQGNILQDHKSGLACNWWENAEADLDLAAEMGKRSREIAEEKYDVHKVNKVMLRDMGIT